MAKRISILVALEGADDGLKRAINSAERSLGELSTTAKTAGDKAARRNGRGQGRDVGVWRSGGDGQDATAGLPVDQLGGRQGAGDRPDRRCLEHDGRAPEAGDRGSA
jgi:hypothetical protein